MFAHQAATKEISSVGHLFFHPLPLPLPTFANRPAVSSDRLALKTIAATVHLRTRVLIEFLIDNGIDSISLAFGFARVCVFFSHRRHYGRRLRIFSIFRASISVTCSPLLLLSLRRSHFLLVAAHGVSPRPLNPRGRESTFSFVPRTGVAFCFTAANDVVRKR